MEATITYFVDQKDFQLAFFLMRPLTKFNILSRYQHGYPWPSLATPTSRLSLPVGPQGYTPYPHSAAVCRFELATLLLHGHVKDPLEYITHELVPTSPAVSCISGSSNLDSFRDGC